MGSYSFCNSDIGDFCLISRFLLQELICSIDNTEINTQTSIDRLCNELYVCVQARACGVNIMT